MTYNVTDKSQICSTLYSTYKITNIYQQIFDLHGRRGPDPGSCLCMKCIDAQVAIRLASDR